MNPRLLVIALLGSSTLMPAAALAQQRILRLPPGMLRPAPVPTPAATPTPAAPTVPLSLPRRPLPVTTVPVAPTPLVPAAVRPAAPVRAPFPAMRQPLPVTAPVSAGRGAAAVSTPPAAALEEAALVQRLGAPRVETLAAVLQRTGPLPRVLANGVRAPLRSHCVSADRAQDAVSFGKSGDGQYVVRFTCGSAARGGRSDAFTITMQGGPKGPLVAGRGPRRIGRAGATLPPTPSRTFAEVNTCLDQFAKYKTGDYVFNLERIGAYPHCSLTPATRLSVLTGTTLKPFAPGQIRTIGLPDIADALIDPQRPERMLRYVDFDTSPIDGVSSHIHQVDEVANTWINPVEGLPPIQNPNGIQIKPGKPGFGVDFLTRGKPGYGLAILQLVRRSSPTPPITVSLNGTTSTVLSAGLGKPDFAPAGAAADQCTTDLAPSGLVGFAIAKIAPIKLARGTDAGWAVPGPVWLSHLELDTTQFTQLLAGRKDGNYWLRVVPVKPPSNTGAVIPDCAGPAGRPVPVRIGYSKEQLASYNAYAEKVGQEVLQKKVDDAVAVAAAQLPGGPGGSSPALVEVVGWLPPDELQETWVMNAVPHDPGSGVNAPLAWTDPKKFLQQVHENVFDLGDAYPSATWPYRKGWAAGKVYSPYGFVDAQNEKEKIESVWDYIGLAINGWSYIYSELQVGLVQSFAYLVSFGRCEPDLPMEEPKEKTKACKFIDHYASSALSQAMKAYGLPPKLPTTADLADQASDFLVTSALSELPPGVSSYLPDKSKEQVKTWLAKQLKTGVLGMECAQPARIDIPAKDQGYDSVDLVTLCGYKAGSFTSFARIEGTPVSPYHATMYVRVRPNPNKVAGADTKITLYADSKQTVVPDLWKKTVVGLGYAFTPLPMDVPITVDLANVPPEGVVVPLVMVYPESSMRWAYEGAGGCGQSQLVGPCVSGAYWFWRDLLLDGKQRMTLKVGYRFASDVTLTETLGTKKEIVASAPALTRYDAKTWEASLGFVQPGLTYAIPDYQPEPGFQVLQTKTLTGLPTNEVVPAFDIDDYY